MGVRARGERIFFIFSSLCFCLRLRKSNRRFSSEEEARRELCVGIKILEFRQTPRVRKISYLCYFYHKGYLMA